MTGPNKAYAPTSVDKQIQHERKEQSKKWRAQKWKDWMEDDDDLSDEGVEVTSEEPSEEKKAS